MATAAIASDTWVVVRLRDQLFGIEARYVQEMTTTQRRRIHTLPRAPVGVAGVLKLRDRVFPVVDLRVLLGMSSMAAETASLVGLLEERERDHVNWLNELEACVNEKREFRLATDPHLCKFGKWYDTMMADETARGRIFSNNVTLERVLLGILRQFDLPHQRIHGVALSVTQALAEQRVDQAHAIIEQTRTTDLAAVRRLFADTRTAVQEMMYPLIGVLEIQGRVIGVLVDTIEAVRDIPQEQVDRTRTTDLATSFVVGFAKQSEDPSGKMTTLLKAESLLADFAATTHATAELVAEAPR
jgi:chemotaxis signal transduction protein